MRLAAGTFNFEKMEKEIFKKEFSLDSLLSTVKPGVSQSQNKQHLTIAPHPVSKHASSSHNMRLIGGGVAPRGWWHIVAKLLQCLQFPAWEQPLSPAWGRLRFPSWEHLPVPCLGRFAVPAWDACQFPAWEGLPVPCLGTLASSLPGNVCQYPAWAGLQSLPGTLCQVPAWERLPMPCLGMFASPCLGRLPVPCLGTPFAGTPSLAELFSYAYRTSMRGELLRLFKPEWPHTPVPCYFVSAMNVK